MSNKKHTAVKATGLQKRLDGVDVLNGLDLQVSYGEIVGIVGPNGSGKTLLLRLLSGLVYPDAGRIQMGETAMTPSTRGIFPDIGILLETPGFLPHLSGRHNLELLASLRSQLDTEDIKRVIERVGLDPDDRRPVHKYSMGMKQRLGIAQAIMENPRILLIDEPMNGLDPDYTDRFLDMMGELRSSGMAIIWTSHQLAEIREAADRILRLRNGVLTADVSD